MWFLRTARLSDQASLSLNNTSKFSSLNTPESLQLLKTIYSHFPNLNYLIVNTDKVG